LKIKENFYKDLNTIISNSNIMLVYSAILKQKHIEQHGKLTDDPHEIALTFISKRILFKFDSRKTNQTVGVII